MGRAERGASPRAGRRERLERRLMRTSWIEPPRPPTFVSERLFGRRREPWAWADSSARGGRQGAEPARRAGGVGLPELELGLVSLAGALVEAGEPPVVDRA